MSQIKPSNFNFINFQIEALNVTFFRIKQHKWKTMLNILLISIILSLLAFLWFSYNNMQYAKQHLIESNLITFFTNTEVSIKELEELEQNLLNIKELKNLQYHTPLSIMQDTNYIQHHLTQQENIPGIFTANLAVNNLSIPQYEYIKNTINQIPNIRKIDFDVLWQKKIENIINLSQILIISLATILSITALLTIIYLTQIVLEKSKQEIEVLSKVGAEIKFIARPFIYKGLFIGSMAAISSIIILYTLQTLSKPYIVDLQELFNFKLQVFNLSISFIATNVILTATIALISSYCAANQWLLKFQEKNNNYI